ncbi:MAG: iron ABC transporter permease [Treponema sp.]|jgi:thiamine transport system permease protein|nr:iron ABC transporter permease [Treponema sp.]
MNKSERVFPWILAAPVLVSALCFFILPYISALSAPFRGAFSGGGRGGVPKALENPALFGVTLFTLKQALLSTLAALALGLPGAWLLGGLTDSPSRAKRGFALLIRTLTGIPFAMPPILVVLAFVLFFGNNGWANRLIMAAAGVPEGPLRILYKPSAVILAHSFYNFPLVIRVAGDGIAQARRAYAPAAASLGASPFITAVTVILPICLPSIMAASLLAFLYCFTSFAVVLVLGGGPAVTTLAVEIYRYARLSLDFQSAGVLALIETLIALTVFLAYVFFNRGGKFSNRQGPKGPGDAWAAVSQDPKEFPMEGKEHSRLGAGVIFIYGAVLLFFVLGPLFSIPAESLLSRSTWSALPRLSLRHWLSLGERVLPALGRSLILASLSATLASFLAILAASSARIASPASPLGNILRLASLSPLASSGIVLALGWLSLYGRGEDGAGNSRSLLAVVILHAVIALPFAFNSVSQGLRSIPPNTANAASVLGAGPFLRILTVEIPISLRRLRSAWAFSAVISLGELNAILMLGMDQWETLPLLIYRAVGSYRYGPACAAGTLLLLASAAAFLVSEISGPGTKTAGAFHGN